MVTKVCKLDSLGSYEIKAAVFHIFADILYLQLFILNLLKFTSFLHHDCFIIAICMCKRTISLECLGAYISLLILLLPLWLIVVLEFISDTDFLMLLLLNLGLLNGSCNSQLIYVSSDVAAIDRGSKIDMRNLQDTLIEQSPAFFLNRLFLVCLGVVIVRDLCFVASKIISLCYASNG